MKPYQAIGYALFQTSAVTNIVGSRIYHGLRPDGDTLPSVNYYRVGGAGRKNGVESGIYSINCRAYTPDVAENLARAVVTLFHGAEGMGTYGEWGTFEISRASLASDPGAIPEPIGDTEGVVYKAPVDIQVVYPVNTIT